MLPKSTVSVQPDRRSTVNLPYLTDNLTAAQRLGLWFESIDWKVAFDVTAVFTAVAFLVWALVKTIALLTAFSITYTAALVGMHPLYCLFGTLVAAFYIRQYDRIGMLAVLFTVINSLAI